MRSERWPGLGLGLALLAMLTAPGRAQDAPTGEAPSAERKDSSARSERPAPPFLRELLAAHNRARAENDKPPLTLAPLLTDAALAHARDMAAHGEMSHEGSDGSTPSERVRRAGYRYLTTGENVAYGHKTIDAVMKDWMNSPHHRENILGDFTEMGAARVNGPDGAPYWAVEFGRPVPKIDVAEAPRQVVEAINALRREKDLPPLTVEPRLERVAVETARTMAENRQTSPPDQGKPVFEDIKASGYAYQSLRLSIAVNQTDVEELVQGLAKSDDPPILGDFRHTGVGVATNDDGLPTWVILLAKPR
jgi:uncharacterized protein YkwD